MKSADQKETCPHSSIYPLYYQISLKSQNPHLASHELLCPLLGVPCFRAIARAAPPQLRPPPRLSVHTFLHFHTPFLSHCSVRPVMVKIYVSPWQSDGMQTFNQTLVWESWMG